MAKNVRKAPTDDGSATLGDETNDKLELNSADPFDEQGPQGNDLVDNDLSVRSGGPEAGDVDHSQTERKVEIVDNGTNIRGHALIPGMVVKLSNFMIEAHRSRGVPLIDVEDDDSRDVYDISEEYVPEQNG